VGFFHAVGFFDFVDDFGADVGEVKHDVVTEANLLLLAFVTVLVDNATELDQVGFLFADELVVKEPELAPADKIVIQVRGGKVRYFNRIQHRIPGLLYFILE